jgi:hypothetical protein
MKPFSMRLWPRSGGEAGTLRKPQTLNPGVGLLLW